MTDPSAIHCPMCEQTPLGTDLTRGRCLDPVALEELLRTNPRWRESPGACAACVQQALLNTRLLMGEDAMHRFIQQVWPLDAEAAFGALPTPLRMHADPRFTGRGITVAQIDSGFYPHPDLVEPQNRIRAWANATEDPVRSLRFTRNEMPHWPGAYANHTWQWHGLMTTTAAFGNGRMSHGLYCGIAPDADLVLVQTWEQGRGISDEVLLRALRWVLHRHRRRNIRVVSISVSGHSPDAAPDHPINQVVNQLVDEGVVVVAAAGNSSVRRLFPPASAVKALTVGGLDDRNVLDRSRHEVWHSNYDSVADGAWKPEVVAPSLWVVAPVLPGSEVAREAQELFRRRAEGDSGVEARIADQKLITPHYQHVEGTSFAAPIVASIVACMLEADPSLSPAEVTHILMNSAYKVPGAAPERQGAGAVDAGRALELTLLHRDRQAKAS